MIRIEKPRIENRSGIIYLISTICSEIENVKEDVWYRTTEEWGDYLNDEVADAFVLPMLLVALRNREDIVVDAPLSEKLYYNIVNNILYTLSIPLNISCNVSVSCAGFHTNEFSPTAVGCGCSLGVDSFSAMIRHTAEDCPHGFRITHLTNFNIGAYGNNIEKSEPLYKEALEDVKVYAAEKKLPLVLLESNFGIFFEGVDFNWCGPIRTMSAVLSMQKLFKRYYYASGSTNKQFAYTDTMCDFASLLIPMLSTESTELIVADQDKNRIDKTAAIVDDPFAQRYLDVCWKRIRANRGDTQYMQFPFKNCTRCSKCIRTLLTLDILGYSENFRRVFDLDYFQRNRDEIIRNYVAKRNVNHYYQEVYQLMLDKNYPIPKDRVAFRVKSAVKAIATKIRKIIK